MGFATGRARVGLGVAIRSCVCGTSLVIERGLETLGEGVCSGSPRASEAVRFPVGCWADTAIVDCGLGMMMD